MLFHVVTRTVSSVFTFVGYHITYVPIFKDRSAPILLLFDAPSRKELVLSLIWRRLFLMNGSDNKCEEECLPEACDYNCGVFFITLASIHLPHSWRVTLNKQKGILIALSNSRPNGCQWGTWLAHTISFNVCRPGQNTGWLSTNTLKIHHYVKRNAYIYILLIHLFFYPSTHDVHKIVKMFVCHFVVPISSTQIP